MNVLSVVLRSGLSYHASDGVGRGRAGVEALVISPVFASNSPSAGRPMGALALARLARAARIPIYALGGINAGTARALKLTGVVGLAAVEALGG